MSGLERWSAPRLAPAAPRPGQPFTDEMIANVPSIDADYRQRAAIPVPVLSVNLNPLAVQKISKPELRYLRQIGFVTASTLDLWGIDVQDPDGFSAIGSYLESVTIPYAKIGRLAL